MIVTARQLVREALDHFTDPHSPVDLRDWIRTARRYLHRATRRANRRSSGRNRRVS